MRKKPTISQSEALTHWEKKIYGQDSHKLKVTLSPRPWALLKAHENLFSRTTEGAIEKLIILGSLKYDQLDKLKVRIESMEERLKEIEELNNDLLKKDMERDDFMLTWAADPNGFESLIRTQDHFQKCSIIEERDGIIAAENYHSNYLASSRENLRRTNPKTPGDKYN